MSLSLKLIIFTIALSIGGCSNPPASEFNVKGLTKNQVLKKLNKPNKIIKYTKTKNGAVLRPRPELFDKLKYNETIEIWHYEAKEGLALVYFKSSGTVEESNIILEVYKPW